MEEEAKVPDSLERTCPPELLGPLPRRVQMSSTDASFLLIVALLFLGSGVAVCAYRCAEAIRQSERSAVLRRDGREILGKVTATHGGHGGSTVSYTFTVNGTAYLSKAEMPNYSLILHNSDPIAIRYLPSDPATNHPAMWEWSVQQNLIQYVFAVFFTTIGSIALAALLRDRKLARKGGVAEGVVTGCAPNKRQYRVEYEFRTDDGVRMHGHCDCWEEYRVGASIWIIYLRNRPQRNRSYPLLYFGIVE